MAQCQSLQRFQTVFDFDDTRMVGQRLTIGYDQAGNTFLGDFEGEVITVEMVAFQSEKHRRRLDVPAVGAYFV